MVFREGLQQLFGDYGLGSALASFQGTHALLMQFFTAINGSQLAFHRAVIPPSTQ